MQVFLIFGSLCAILPCVLGLPIPVPTHTGQSSLSFVQPSIGVQYSTFIQHHPFVRLHPAQGNFVQPLLYPLGYYQPLLLVQPIQLLPSAPNATAEEPKPGNSVASLEMVKQESPSQDYGDAVQTEVGSDSNPAVPPMKNGDFDLDGLEKDGETRGKLEASEQDDDSVAVAVDSVARSDDTRGTGNYDAEDE